MVPHPCYKLKHSTPSAVFSTHMIMDSAYFLPMFFSFSAGPVLQGHTPEGIDIHPSVYPGKTGLIGLDWL